jgi:hypothetical protein
MSRTIEKPVCIYPFDALALSNSFRVLRRRRFAADIFALSSLISITRLLLFVVTFLHADAAAALNAAT